MSIFYFIYLIFVLFFIIFTFFNAYHLVKFGFLTFSNIIIISFYIIVSVLILLISFNYINQIDWKQTMSFDLNMPY